MNKPLQRPKLGEHCKTTDDLFMGDCLYLDGELVSVHRDLGEEVDIIRQTDVFEIQPASPIKGLTPQTINKQNRVKKTQLLAPGKEETQALHLYMLGKS